MAESNRHRNKRYVYIADGARRKHELMKKRKCIECGASLTDEDVMKIKVEDGSWETIPLPVCPDCFKKQMSERVSR